MIPSPDGLTEEADRELARAAIAARKLAGARVSGFAVGASLQSAHGTYSAGNIESPTNIFNLCAERAALVVAHAAEGPDLTITAVAVCADASTVSPCGACRQLLVEFGPETRVIYIRDGAWVAEPIRELLPVAFDGWSAGSSQSRP